jgi:perosamine synthetase
MIITKKDIEAILYQLKNIEHSDWKGIFENFKDKVKNIFWSKYVILTNNWTSALYLAYKAVWLKAWDEVLSWNYVFHSTNSTILNFTKNIKLCDYDNDITINFEEIEKQISSKTKLLIIPYTWWLSPNIEKIIKLKEKYESLFIIEDCSQAHFAKYNWKYLWTFWDIGVFSMQGGKILTSWEWGFAITNHKELYEKMLINSDSWNNIDILLEETSKYKKYVDTWLWLLKFRPNPIWIAFVNSQIDNIFEKIKIRKYFAEFIKNEIKNIKFICFPEIKNLEQSYYALVWIYEKEKNNNIEINDFLELLRKNNIFEIYNPKNNKPNHLLPLFKENIWEICLENSEKIYKNLLSFKISDDINDISIIKNYIKNFKILCEK